jgi:ABC-type sugar transport system substrate-binding protein
MPHPGRTLAVYLPDAHNPYMQEMAVEAQAEGHRLGYRVEVAFADDDFTVQVRQVYAALAAPEEQRPLTVIIMPVQERSVFTLSEGILDAGVGCIFLNRIRGRVEDLQKQHPDLPVALVTPDQREAGRIQARQLLTLLPAGGNVLSIRGRVTNSSAEERATGLKEVLNDSSIRLVASLPGNWSAADTEQVLGSWLTTELALHRRVLHAIVCDSDYMAEGALKVLDRFEAELRRLGGPSVAVLGCDGVASIGRQMVDDGALTATTVLPTTAGRAVQLAHDWFAHGARLPARVVLPPQPYPSMAALRARTAATAR